MTLHETLWVDGTIVARSMNTHFPDKRTPTIDDVTSLMVSAIRLAMDSKRPWLYQAHNDGAKSHRAYYRFGTDTRGMVDPIKFTKDALHG